MLDTWYDLAIRELSDLTDPAKEKLTEAEESEMPDLAQPDPEEPDSPTA